MKLYLEAYRHGFKLGNGPGDNLYPLDGLTVLTVSSLKIFLQTCCCTSNNNNNNNNNKKKKKGLCCSFCSKGYNMWNNLPQGFEFLKGDNNKWWFEKGRSNREYASVYVDGGTMEHKIQSKDEFELKEGSSLFIRPPIEHREEEWMVNMEFRVVAGPDAPVPVGNTAAAPRIATVRSDLFISSPAASMLSSDFKTPTTAQAKGKSGTSPLSVYSCTPDGGYPVVERVVIDNPYSGVTADHLRQAFGLTDEEKDVALAQQVEEGRKALAVELVGMGFSPDLKRKREEDDDDDDGDLIQFP